MAPKLLRIRKPKLSIVMPVYNRERFVQQSIESILEQSFRDYELIILNDGSTDATEQLVKSYSDTRIVYVKQRNRGEPWATNTGLRMAQGDYITWVHSDDVLPPGSLMARVRCLNENKGVDLCHGDITTMDENGTLAQHLPAFNGDGKSAFSQYYKPPHERVCSFPIHHTTVMFRREFLPTVGYWDEKLPCAVDMDWLLRALKFGRIKKARGILYWYRFHANTQRQIKIRRGLDFRAMMQVILQRYAEKAS
jgi:glycosyltransferase involved in cell wall biosynthesis